jgi:hypothetical protein
VAFQVERFSGGEFSAVFRVERLGGGGGLSRRSGYPHDV